MGWKLPQVCLTNIRKGERFKINVAWQGKIRVGVGGVMLSKLGQNKGPMFGQCLCGNRT